MLGVKSIKTRIWEAIEQMLAKTQDYDMVRKKANNIAFALNTSEELVLEGINAHRMWAFSEMD